MKKRKKHKTPRNPYIVPMHQRKSGRHEDKRKKKDKRACRDWDRGDDETL